MRMEKVGIERRDVPVHGPRRLHSDPLGRVEDDGLYARVTESTLCEIVVCTLETRNRKTDILARSDPGEVTKQ